MAKQLRIGMIGYGFMGRTHSNAYRRVTNFFDLEYHPVLQAVCARNAEQVQAFADRWGYASIETDWRKLVERKDIDAIDICTPNNLHKEMALAAAANGKIVVMVAESLPRAKLRANPDYPDAADPHVWMDPVLWAEAAGSIAAGLARLIPDQAGVFEANLAALRRRLAALHDYGARVMGSIPPRQRLLVTAHDAFGYFSARYGMEVDSIQGLSTESEANLARIEALVRSLVERRIPAVFAESSVPDRAVRALIEGAGARGQRVALGGTLFSDSLGKPGTYEGTYHGMMDHNFTTIARALGGEAPARGMLGRLAAA